MLEDRLMTNEYEIERRDSLHARAVQAVETRPEEEQQQAIREIIRGDWVRPNPLVESKAASPGTAKALNLSEDNLMVHVMLRDPEVLNLYSSAAVDALPQPGPPKPPPPKQASASLQSDMEQAMAIAKAKNASKDTGWASNLVEAAGRAIDAMNTALHAEGPRAV
eukprot:2004029-Amphidinium_carterae.1